MASRLPHGLTDSRDLTTVEISAARETFPFDRDAMLTSSLRLGSLTCQLYYTAETRQYAQFLASHFRITLQAAAEVPRQNVDLEFVFAEDCRVARDHFQALRDCNSTLIPFDNGVVIGTDLAVGYLFTDTTPNLMVAPFVNAGYTHEVLIAYLLAFIHRVLLVLDRMPFHAAAIHFEGRTSLFIGDKGTGKTTISLKASRLGGVIIGEDHIMLKRMDDRFWVSGMDEITRITSKTEQHLFEAALPFEAMDYAGMMKKELALAAYFDSAPHVDFPVHRLFFNHVGQEFKVQRISEAQGFLDLVERTKAVYRLRPPHTGDFSRYFDYLNKFTGTIPAFDLELSPDLSQLDRLVEVLR